MLSGGSLTDFNTGDTDLTNKVRMFLAAISSTLLVPILELSSARSILAARAAKTNIGKNSLAETITDINLTDMRENKHLDNLGSKFLQTRNGSVVGNQRSFVAAESVTEHLGHSGLDVVGAAVKVLTDCSHHPASEVS